MRPLLRMANQNIAQREVSDKGEALIRMWQVIREENI